VGAPDPAAESPPDPADLPERRGAYIHPTPNGDLIVNTVGMVEGSEWLRRSPEDLRALCERRVRAHVRWLQREKGMADWRLIGIAPAIGIRESYRIAGEEVLTEHDCAGGLASQRHPDIVALPTTRSTPTVRVAAARAACRTEPTASRSAAWCHAAGRTCWWPAAPPASATSPHPRHGSRAR
jgi:hypothetical protein